MAPLFIVFSNLGLGGIQKKIIDIVNLLANTNPTLPIYILLRRKDDFDLSGEIKNKRAVTVYYTDWARVKTPFFFSVFVLCQVWRLKPKVILAFLSPFSLPAVLAKLVFFGRKIQVVINEDHYTSGIVPLLRYSQLNRWGISLFYPHADLIISPTRAAKKDLVDNFSVPGGKIKIVLNWTNLADKKIIRTRKEYDLVYAGRLVKTKRVDLLLRGVVKLKKHKKNIKFCLLGDGEEKSRLEDFARKEGITHNVSFLGTKGDVENYLAKSRLFVCFSQFRAEGFPLAILEAMAMEVPVLTSRFAGAEEVIKEEENGFFFDSMDEFVKKSLWLLKNPGKRQIVAREAKKTVKKNHSLENIKDYLDGLGIKP